MPAQATDELRDFHQFLSKKLSNHAGSCSPEQALDEWRRLHPDQQAAEEDLAAIREALADVAQGDCGVPFAEFDRAFRKRHHLPGQP